MLRSTRAPLAALLLLGLLPAAGCKDEPPPAPVSTVPAGMKEGAFQGVKFHYPVAWTAGPHEATKGLDVTLPVAEDDDFPAGMLFRVDDAPAGRSLEQMLLDANKTMASESDEYVLKTKNVNAHPAGFQYGKLEYTKRSQGSPGVPLTRRELVILFGANRRLTIQISASTASWKKYEPAFDEVIESLRLPEGK